MTAGFKFAKAESVNAVAAYVEDMKAVGGLP
jgi:hypothetical protein